MLWLILKIWVAVCLLALVLWLILATAVELGEKLLKIFDDAAFARAYWKKRDAEAKK